MQVNDGECCLCGKSCDGSFMRMNPRFDRVRHMLTAPEVPRFSGGGIALCHMCQRMAYFEKGFLALLVKELRRKASAIQVLYKRGPQGGGVSLVLPRHMIRAEAWQRVLEAYAPDKPVKQIAEDADVELTTVYDIMRKHSLPTVTQSRKAASRQKRLEGFDEALAAKIKDMRIGGQSWDGIAAKIGETRERVMAAHIALTGGL